MFFTIFKSLNASIFNRANFLRFKFVPFSTIKFKVKFSQNFIFFKIYKCIPHVTIVVKINWQVKKIKWIRKLMLHFFKKHFFSIFIRDVFNHHCSSMVLFVRIDVKILLFIFNLFLFPFFDHCVFCYRFVNILIVHFLTFFWIYMKRFTIFKNLKRWWQITL